MGICEGEKVVTMAQLLYRDLVQCSIMSCASTSEISRMSECEMFIQHGFKLNMVKLSSYCIYNYDNLLSNLSVIQVCLD